MYSIFVTIIQLNVNNFFLANNVGVKILRFPNFRNLQVGDLIIYDGKINYGYAWVAKINKKVESCRKLQLTWIDLDKRKNLWYCSNKQTIIYDSSTVLGKIDPTLLSESSEPGYLKFNPEIEKELIFHD